MGFWIVMFILLAISAFLIYQCVAAAKNRRENRRRDDDYEQENHERPRSRKSQAGQVQSARRRRDEHDESEVDEEEEEYIPRRAGQKQWKILLENLDTWEKYTFMFYDEVGIGRAKDSPDFEQFLTIEGDPKVSKQHCTIIRKGGRLYIEDLGSKNGTFLNEEWVDEPVLIQKEDIIRVGETRIEINKILRERD